MACFLLLTLRCFALLGFAWLCVALRCVCVAFALRCVALRCLALPCIALPSFALPCFCFCLCFPLFCCALPCFALLCLALFCFALLLLALLCFALLGMCLLARVHRLPFEPPLPRMTLHCLVPAISFTLTFTLSAARLSPNHRKPLAINLNLCLQSPLSRRRPRSWLIHGLCTLTENVSWDSVSSRVESCAYVRAATQE